jgi:hypothetical protein
VLSKCTAARLHLVGLNPATGPLIHEGRREA